MKTFSQSAAGILALALALAACEREEGLLAVGTDEPSALEQTRFVKRLHLDLAGVQPNDEDVAEGVARLAEADTAATRAGIADELLARPAFAVLTVGEIENRVFAGSTADDAYALFCPILKDTDPTCAACEYTLDCSGCACTTLSVLHQERESLHAAADDLAAGSATIASIERRFAESQIFRFNAGSVDGITLGLFENFLGRPPEPDEEKNVRALVFGTFIEGSPVGLLFHRLGEDYDDLIDIVWSSEVYREALVDGVFVRYLGRKPTPAELLFFVSGLDPVSPDVRPVIRAVVSSGEYYGQ
jgi:hypothetical protein